MKLKRPTKKYEVHQQCKYFTNLLLTLIKKANEIILNDS